MLIEFQNPNLENRLQETLKKGAFSNSLNTLPEKILFKISVEKQLQSLKTKLYGAFAILTATLALFIFSIDTSLKAFAKTPTFKFISLFFTDFSHIAAYWQDYTYSLLETLPLQSMAFLLISFLACLLLGQYALEQFSGFKKIANSTLHAK